MVRSHLIPMILCHYPWLKLLTILNLIWKIWVLKSDGTMSSIFSMLGLFLSSHFSSRLARGRIITKFNILLWLWPFCIMWRENFRLLMFMFLVGLLCHSSVYLLTLYITGYSLPFVTASNYSFSQINTHTTQYF